MEIEIQGTQIFIQFVAQLAFSLPGLLGRFRLSGYKSNLHVEGARVWRFNKEVYAVPCMLSKLRMDSDMAFQLVKELMKEELKQGRLEIIFISLETSFELRLR
ncbi:MAG: hypothetical protein GTN81_06345 [Proteobacteria bacterium]|nr:hypothetical protein [Pseudomonadota bacterium]